jgi:hypothetical protein
MGDLFRVLSKRFRVDAVWNQKCSEFEGVFDLPRRFSVQSLGSIGSENHHVVVRIYHHLPLEGHLGQQKVQKVSSVRHNSTSDGGENAGCVSPVAQPKASWGGIALRPLGRLWSCTSGKNLRLAGRRAPDLPANSRNHVALGAGTIRWCGIRLGWPWTNPWETHQS